MNYRVYQSNVKMRNNCMSTVKLIIKKHNKTVLHPRTNTKERTCSCINKETCPLQEKCLTNNILYKATLTSNQNIYQHKVYYGVTYGTIIQTGITCNKIVSQNSNSALVLK